MTDRLTIKTNNVPRDVLYWFDLSDKERKDFDYIKDDESPTFFRYRGNVYDLGEFMRHAFPDLSGWDGYSPDSYFSGVVVRFVDDYDRVVCGTYFA
jgi:hypothetical protein